MNRRVLPPLAAACATISLGPTLPSGSSSLPGAQRGRAVPCPQADVAPAWPCSQWGLPGRAHCWTRRWSLTPPFHPHRSLTRAAVVFCGPVRGFPRPGVARHRALWSADFPRAPFGKLRTPTVARPTCLPSHHSRPPDRRQCGAHPLTPIPSLPLPTVSTDRQGRDAARSLQGPWSPAWWERPTGALREGEG